MILTFVSLTYLFPLYLPIALFPVFLFVRESIICPLIYGFILALLMALVCSVKLPVGDLETYIEQYRYLGSLPGGSFSTFFGKDLFFYGMSKLIYELTYGDVKFFIFFWMFVFYFNINISLYLLMKNGFITYQSFFVSVFLICTSVMLMQLSSHLMRQFLACSFLVLSLILYILNKKNILFFVLLLMCFTHFSSSIFALFFFDKILSKKISLVSFLLILVSTVIVSQINFLSFFSSVLVEDSNIYTTHIVGSADGVQNDGEVPFKVYLLSVIAIAMLYYLVYLKNKIELYPLFNLTFILFVWFNLFIKVPLLWLRYSFYLYPFFFLIFSLLMSSFNNNLSKLLCCILAIMSFLNLYIFFETSFWVDANIEIQVINKSLSYFL